MFVCDQITIYKLIKYRLLSIGILKAIDMKYVTIVHLQRHFIHIIFVKLKVLNRVSVSPLKGVDFSPVNTGTNEHY